ncbi:hypothetical protein JXA32_03980 [Candidatus Sumerlaeota bacterium]|nr:hypothetical protein [Candidatus Sumerlaeota bacterium]
MYSDEIISEVWRHRDDYAKKHQYSLKKMIADLKKRQKRPFTRIIDRRASKHMDGI